MKNFLIIAGCVAMGVFLSGCDKARRNTGHAYMPDMAYSVAYETYAPTNRLDSSGARYNGMPVPGTIARGELMPYALRNDSSGYNQSAEIKSPIAPESFSMKEAERLYLVNCAICHGSNLDGNGPLYKDGSGPFLAKPATLVGDAKYEAMSEGTMYHVSTYGKGAMGSYASQLSSTQRWMVVAYIKSKQKGGKAGAAAGTDSTAAKTAGDSTTAAMNSVSN